MARFTLAMALVVMTGAASFGAGDAPGSTGTSARRVPEALNFANGLFRERRYELAAKEYEGFLKDAKPGPEAAEARFGLANARLFQGEYGRARDQFQEFLKLAPEHPNAPTAWYRVGETAYMLGDLESARRAFETYTNDYPKHKHLDTAWPYLGDVCLRTGDLAKARRAYEQSLKAYPEGRMADRARFGLGRALALQGESEAALGMFTALAEKGGKDWADRAWYQIGQVEVGAERYEQAIEAFEKVEAVAPQSALIAEARLNRGEVLIKLGRREEGERLLRGVAAEGTQNIAAQAAFALGTSELESGRAVEALKTLDDGARRFPKAAMASALVFRSAEAALKLGKADDARARFLRAAEVDSKDPWADDALARAARLALDQGDNEGASKLAETFAKRFPESPLLADARLVMARGAYNMRRYKEAIATLTASLASDKPGPATAEAERYYLGLAYRADGQAAKASEVLDELAKTPAAPIAADAQFLVGQGYVDTRRYAEAIEPLEKYLAAKPKGDVADYAWMYLIQARLETGDAEGAWKALGELAGGFPKSKTLSMSRIRVAEAALAGRQLERATEQFTLASVDPAVASRARLGLGWALLDSEKPKEAAASFAAFLIATPEDPLAPEAALAQGRALEAAKEKEAALAAYTSAVEKYPKAEPTMLAALARARLLVDAKRPLEAAEAYGRFVVDHPDYKPKEASALGFDAILAAWGWALIDGERAAEGDKVFTRLLNEFPESPLAADARFNLAESANQSGNHDEVVRLLSPLVAEGTKAAPRLVQSGLYRLGRTQAEKKDWSSAAKTLDRLLAEYPETTFRREARLLRAEVALEAGDVKASEALLTALGTEAAEPGDPAGFGRAVKRRRIHVLFALKKWNEVIQEADALRAEAADDPSTSEADFLRGRALMTLARFEEARAGFQRVIDARKGGEFVARSQFMIGETYFHQKDYHEAIRNFLKVDILYDAPTWQASALLETGKAYEQLDQWADAAETYERLRAKFADDPSAKLAEARLEEARKHIAETAKADAPSAGTDSNQKN